MSPIAPARCRRQRAVLERGRARGGDGERGHGARGDRRRGLGRLHDRRRHADPAQAVSYPASSFWVTGVGGTNLRAEPCQPDHVADRLERRGRAARLGRRRRRQRPVQAPELPERRQRAPRNRAVPGRLDARRHRAGIRDLSARSLRDCIPSRSSPPWVGIGGTSAATPLLAGGAALVDQELRAARRRALGLANPLLYAIERSPAAASMFFDVTSIGNDVGPFIPGNGRPLGCCSRARRLRRGVGARQRQPCELRRDRRSPTSRRSSRVGLSLPGAPDADPPARDPRDRGVLRARA